MPDLRRLLASRSYAFALLLTVGLAVANVVALPAFGSPHAWAGTAAVFAPFAIAAMASTPAVIGGGIDLSVGPLMGLTNVVLVSGLLSHGLGHPAVAIPIVLGLGAAVGLVNGVLVTVLGYQPVIATLCTLFVLTGITLKIAPTPALAPAGNWTGSLAGSFGPVPGALLVLGAPVLTWLVLKRTAFYRQLFAVGADDTAAYSAAVDVTAVRMVSYLLGGLFAAVGGIALTAIVQSGDATVGNQYVLVALAAVAVGGTPIGTGGRGGLLGSVLGAAGIYLLQNLLSELQVNALWNPVIYGFVLLAGLVTGARVRGVLQAGTA